MLVPKPLPPTKRSRQKRIGYMTIAAGFQFNGGILICADRQYSGSSIKFFDTKIIHSSVSVVDSDDVVEPMQTVIAMSGTDGYMQTVADKIEMALADACTNAKNGCVNEVEAIEDALVEAYKKHIYPHPHYGYTTGPAVELLIGVWTKGSNARIFRTAETSVNELTFCDPCVFVGSGSDVARYAIRPLMELGRNLHNVLTRDECILIATHALRVAKQNDVYCGGDSEFAVLYDSGEIGGVAQGKIETLESYSETFDVILRRLFFSIADVDSRFSPEVFNLSGAQIDLIRNEQAKLKLERDRLSELLKPKWSASQKSVDRQ